MSGPTREWEASFDWLRDASTAPAAAKGFALWDKGRQKETTGPRVHANLRVPRFHQVSFTFRTKALVFGAALALSAADPERCGPRAACHHSLPALHGHCPQPLSALSSPHASFCPALVISRAWFLVPSITQLSLPALHPPGASGTPVWPRQSPACFSLYLLQGAS